MASNSGTNTGEIQKPWWTPDLDERLRRERVLECLKDVAQRQRYRTALNLKYMMLYNDGQAMGFAPTQYARIMPRTDADRLRFNLVQSAIDTLMAKIAKNKPRPMFLTSGGDWSMRKRAKLANRFVEGEFYRLDLYRTVTMRCFLQAAVFGTGIAYTFKGSDGKAAIEWVFPDELKIDDEDGIYGQPRSFYRVKQVDRQLLREKYPASVSAINATTGAMLYPQLTPYRANLTCTMVEAHHLPTSMLNEETGEVEQTGGWHWCGIEGATFVDEAYDDPDGPYDFLHLNDKPLGFHGRGFAEPLASIQQEITRASIRVQEMFHLMAVPRYLVNTASNFNVQHLTNTVGTALSWSGDPGMKPEVWIANGLTSEPLQYIENLIQKGYNEVGISMLSARAEKPEGLDSGKALNTYEDIESERFMVTGQRWEAFHMAIAKRLVKIAREIADESGKYVTRYADKGSFLEIDWRDIDLAADDYVMQVFPVSALSNTPAARMAEVQDLVNMGVVEADEGWKLLDFPDIDAARSLKLAATELIDKQIDRMLDDGEYDPPDPLQGPFLDQAIKKMNLAYLQARENGADDKRLDLLRQWITEATGMQQSAAPSAAPPGAPGPGGPGGPGLQPPPGPQPGDNLSGMPGVMASPGMPMPNG